MARSTRNVLRIASQWFCFSEPMLPYCAVVAGPYRQLRRVRYKRSDPWLPLMLYVLNSSTDSQFLVRHSPPG